MTASPGGARRAHAHRVEVHGEELESLALEHAPDVLPDAPVAAEDHVLAPRERLVRRLQPLEAGLARPGLAQQEARDALVVPDEKRRDQHADGDRGEERLREFRGDQLVVQEDREQREAELAALRDHDAGAQRLEPLARERPRRQHDDRGLEHEQSGKEREDRRQVPEQRGHVELHADRHEEEPEQRVAEWPDAGLDLVAVLGFRQHHAGEEGAERKGEACGMRRPGGADRDEEHGEREQLRRAARRDLVEQRPQQPAPRGQHDDERDGGLGEGERDLGRRVVVLRRREHAGEREEGHDGQVLEEEGPEGEPPVRAVELVLFGELAEHDRGRGHGDRTAEQDRDGDRQAEGPADRGDRGRGRGDLDAAEPEHLAARCEHARQREFESQREEQEDDAEFGERAGRLRDGDPAEREGPDDHADQQEGEDHRQSQAAQAHDDGERRREQ